MKHRPEYTINHPLVQAMKRNFQRNNKRRDQASLSFGQLFRLWCDVNTTLRTVATITKTTRQAVSLQYHKYFEVIFGPLKNRDALRIQARFESKMSKERIAILTSSSMRTIVRNARMAGCRVEAVPVKKGSREARAYVQRRRLLVNGWVVAVHCVFRAHETPWSKRGYAAPRISFATIEEVDATIVYAKVRPYPERIFIIRSDMLRERLWKPGKKAVNIYPPLEKLPEHRKVNSHFEYWPLENAWHLLAPKSSDTPPVP